MEFSATVIARHMAGVREAAPLVQCMTNAVVMNFSANALLACGCSPAMVDIPEDGGVFAAAASALLINLGTPYAEQREAMRDSAAVAARSGTPWVLDPVAVGPLPVRTRLAAQLLPYKPTAIRGNPSEIMALAGVGGGGRGADSSDSAQAALPAAQDLAARCGSIVAISGPQDIVTDGRSELRLGNGDQLLTRITGGGCALGAITAAFLAAAPAQPLQAVAAATSAYTIAAEQAAASAAGPGSFAVQLLDALYNLDAATIAARARVA